MTGASGALTVFCRPRRSGLPVAYATSDAGGYATVSSDRVVGLCRRTVSSHESPPSACSCTSSNQFTSFTHARTVPRCHRQTAPIPLAALRHDAPYLRGRGGSPSSRYIVLLCLPLHATQTAKERARDLYLRTLDRRLAVLAPPSRHAVRAQRSSAAAAALCSRRDARSRHSAARRAAQQTVAAAGAAPRGTGPQRCSRARFRVAQGGDTARGGSGGVGRSHRGRQSTVKSRRRDSAGA